MKLTLGEIASACNAKLCNGDMAKEITGVCTDSRKVREGDLFLAIKGENVDGHKFIPQVVQAGAAAVLCEDLPQDRNACYIQVKNVLDALCEIAEFYRSKLDIPIIGITGSVGKTSTKECIAGVLAQKYSVLKTQANFNNEIGVPLTLLQIRENHEVAVIEMGINHFGEMHHLSQMVKPDYVVITNIGECHLEFLGDRDGVLRAKSEIFDFISGKGQVVLNGMDDKLVTLQKIGAQNPIFFGLSDNCSYTIASKESLGLFGTKMRIQTPKCTFEATMPLPGTHMVQNALAAAALGESLGLTTEQITAGLESMQPTSGRSNILRLAKWTLIDDCYNANPVSTCAAIDLLSLANTRKVAILGDMFELGEDSANMHGRVGYYAAEKGVDVLICVGADSANMAHQAENYVKQYGQSHTRVYYYATKADMLAHYREICQQDDTILVKASHGMGFAEVVEFLKA